MTQALPKKRSSQDRQEIDNETLNEVLSGLMSSPKQINSKYFYDEYGSQLFEAITQLPEYYPTRTEMYLLERFSGEIGDITGQGIVLLEPGAGNCSKVRPILRSLRPACYVPTDISKEHLFSAARKLQQEFGDIPVFPAAGNMESEYRLPTECKGIPRVLFFPGSTIGNYTPERAVGYLKHIRKIIGADGALLIGVDLQKDPAILHDAYNDAAGVTASFNLNCLTHINSLTGSNFDISKFQHIAFYNEQVNRIEMHLESLEEQSVSVAGKRIAIASAERILTEYSYKYTVRGFAELAAMANLKVQQHWTDEDSLFSLHLCTSTSSD